MFTKRKPFKTMKTIISLSALASIVLIGGITLVMWGCPRYRVYEQTLQGEAELKRAEQNRKIVVQEAQAKEESAKALAQAEVVRAQGVAKANEIIGNSLRGNEAYLRYLWIDGLQTNQQQVVYIPTEAGLPILEANRLTPKP